MLFFNIKSTAVSTKNSELKLSAGGLKQGCNLSIALNQAKNKLYARSRLFKINLLQEYRTHAAIKQLDHNASFSLLAMMAKVPRHFIECVIIEKADTFAENEPGIPYEHCRAHSSRILPSVFTYRSKNVPESGW